MAQPTRPVIGTDRESMISIVLGAIVVIIIGALAFRYFRNRSTPPVMQEETEENEETVVEVQELPTEVQLEENEEGQSVPTNLPAQYTVRDGDTTWGIAEAFYGSGFNYVDIEAANGLTSDQGLNVGMKLTIPRIAVRTAEQAGMPSQVITAQEGEMPSEQGNGPTKGDDSQAREVMSE